MVETTNRQIAKSPNHEIVSRPNWAEISLPTLRRNFEAVSDFVAPHATVCAVVKCDAYGHGAIACATELESAGAKWFGVTSPEEGSVLRSAGVRGRILLMSGFWRGEEDTVVEHDLTPSVWSPEQIASLNSAAERHAKSNFAVHVEVDTGMARQGVPIRELARVLEALRKAGSLCLEGLHSHLASAEVVDAADVQEQFAGYRRALQQLADAGMRPACLHIANSAGLMAHRTSWEEFGSKHKSLTLVRPGLALYGYSLPFQTEAGQQAELKVPEVRPVLSWKTRIIDLRDVAAGQRVGYNGTYVSPAPARIATIACGYGDGLSRSLSSRGQLLIRGAIVPIVGRISMDVTTLDVTSIPGVEVGDEVVLIGRQGEQELTAWDMAKLTGTIPYEVLCNISKRVKRVPIAL